jgi:predicted negative regulator of RcsB-dependent stress response
MVEDYLSDREQEEALRNWWRDNWKSIVGGVVLGLGLLGGWRYWEVQRAQSAAEAVQLYEQFRGALSGGDIEQANQVLQDLSAHYDSSAYAQHSRLLLAKNHMDKGEFDAARALLQAVIDNSKDEELVQVARLRSARVLVQQGKHDEALRMLDVQGAGAFAAQAREIRGDALLAKGDREGARAEYAAALAAAAADPQVDRGMLELKLQEVGGSSAPASVQGQP